MIVWLINNPIFSGLITVILMWCDWLLSLAQEREMKEHYFKHYQSYPINTIEGNPMLQKDIAKNKLISIKHILVSLAIGIAVYFALTIIPNGWCELFLGYVWGLFLLVITQHLSNLFGYRAGRKGLHGKLWMHQRTGLITQSGRYFSTFLLMLFLSFISKSHFIFGMTIAGFTSALRQFIWIRKVPKINDDDSPPNIAEASKLK